MSHDERDQQFLDKTRQLLDQGSQALDEPTIARIKAARLRALDRVDEATGPVSAVLTRVRRRPTIVMFVFLLVMTGVYWQGLYRESPVQVPDMGWVEDLELLSAEEDPSFFLELDFYDWLDVDTVEAG